MSTNESNHDAIATAAEKIRNDPESLRAWQVSEGYPDDGADHPAFWDWCLARASQQVRPF